jgi:hypothetical protein
MTSKICYAIEFQLYSYMLKLCPQRDLILNIISKALLRENVLKVRPFDRNYSVNARIEARMSGDMWTSLGNGFTNLMVMSYLAQKMHWRGLTGLVEGDDGVFRVTGPIPDQKDFESLGFEIKMEKFTRLSDAGFCKLHFSDDSYDNLVDPIYCVMRFGWTSSKLMNSGWKMCQKLLVAKANSLACLCGTTPIIHSLIRMVYRCLPGITPASAAYSLQPYRDRIYEYSNLGKCIEKTITGPSLAQREFVEEKWHITIEDQLRVEKYLDSLDSIQPLNHPDLLRYCWERFGAWAQMWNWNYVSVPDRAGL